MNGCGADYICVFGNNGNISARGIRTLLNREFSVPKRWNMRIQEKATGTLLIVIF